MSFPRHRIRREVLEVIIQDQDAAWRLQSELSRIQSRSLEAIIDRCCTEASDPDRIHRIDSLVVDLGQVSLDKLEHDLAEKLGPALREALVAQIRKQDEAAALEGEEPETISRLELVAFFARTGRLPWWADASRPRLLDETVGALLRRDARPLVALVRELSSDRGALRRIVVHCEEERLAALFSALVALPEPGVAERQVELASLLRAHGALDGATASGFRNAVWMGALRAVCAETNAGGGPVRFWRGTLAVVALELGVTYRRLVMGLQDKLEPSAMGRPDLLAGVVQQLAREIRGEAPATGLTSQVAPRQEPDEVAVREHDRDREDDRDPDHDREHEHDREDDRDHDRDHDREYDRDRDRLDRGAADSGERLSGVEESRDDSHRPAASDAGDVQELEAILERIERSAGPLRALFAELRRVAPGIPAHRRRPVLDALRDLERQTREHGPAAAETAHGMLELVRQVIASHWLPAHVLARVLEAPEQAAATNLPAEALDEDQAAPDRSTGESEQRIEPAAGDASHPPAASDAGDVHELEAILARIEPPAGPLRTLFAELRRVAPGVPAQRRGPVLDALRDLERQTREHGPAAAETAHTMLQLVRQVIASHWLPAHVLARVLEAPEQAAATNLPAEALDEDQAAPDRSTGESGQRIEPAAGDASHPPAASDAGDVHELEAILARIEPPAGPLRTLFAELRRVAPGVPAQRRGPVLDALRDLKRQTREHGPAAAETAHSILQLVRQVIALQWLPAHVLERVLEAPEQAAATNLQAAATNLPAEVLREAQRLLRRARSEATRQAAAKLPRLDLAYGDSGEAYVDNAGLVILWPFLGHLFDHLELLEDKQFKNRSALHRAAGLLQYLATEDPSPPEYQLALPKVLCGMPMEEVFDFGPPVTEAEAEECKNLLTAVIANAPILRDMSIAGFRGTFLLRKGVLSAPGGAWLLRVERASYDVVLDRFPWGMSWVKLPWMEAPLCVEW